MTATWRRKAASAAPCLLLLSPLPLAAQTGDVWVQVHASARQSADLARAVTLLRGVAGRVVCEDLLMCFRAGRPSFFDAYYVLDQIALGRMRAQRIDELIGSRRLAAVEIGVAADPYTPGQVPARFSPSFMASLQANYRPVFRGEVFSIYVPNETGTSAARR